MGLLDKMKEAAGPLVQGAKDKITDVTGIDADKLIEAADHVVDAGDNVSAAADALEAGQKSG